MFFHKKFDKEAYLADIEKGLKEKWENAPIALQELILDHYVSEDIKTLVFVDKCLDVDWMIKPPNVKKEQLELISQAMSLESLPHKHLPEDEIVEFKKIIGNAVVAGINESKDELERLRKEALSFHEKRITELSRKWTLLILVPIMMFALLFILFNQNIFLNESNYVTAAISGLLGALLSLSQRVSGQNLDSSAGVWLHIFEILNKMLVGALSGFIMIFISEALLSQEIEKILLKDINGLITLSFIAGFSERLVPRIISKYSNSVEDKQ